MYALKALSHEGVASALAKAEHYRSLKESAEAESICRDILAIEPENQQALICLLLAQSDQIARDSQDLQQRPGIGPESCMVTTNEPITRA